MVYYGALSKGCERCRERKVKCDQRRPECSRCEKFRAKCPGYRDLGELSFRDESDKVIRKNDTVSSRHTGWRKSISRLYDSVVSPHTTSELAAGFFFTKYAYDDPRMPNKFQEWLYWSYLKEDQSQILRSTVDAVGLAGLSNIHHAPALAAESRSRYCVALETLSQALEDPQLATTDVTFIAVMLLAFFETVNFDAWDRFEQWAAHVQGASALLELRGLQQLESERGTLLYMITRAQIVQACMQQGLPVPHPLVRITCQFANGDIRRKWRKNNVASHGSMCEISFRIVNLRAAVNRGDISDHEHVRKTAIEIDHDLEAWRRGVPREWAQVDRSGLNILQIQTFREERPFYPSLWIAEAWNNWRTLRILTNQIIAQSERLSFAPDYTRISIAINWIRKLSTDICASVLSFEGTSRILTLIQPLRLVCEDENNEHNVRTFAIEQLRHIEKSMGIRQAGLFANTAAKKLDEQCGEASH